MSSPAQPLFQVSFHSQTAQILLRQWFNPSNLACLDSIPDTHHGPAQTLLELSPPPHSLVDMLPPIALGWSLFSKWCHKPGSVPVSAGLNTTPTWLLMWGEGEITKHTNSGLGVDSGSDCRFCSPVKAAQGKTENTGKAPWVWCYCISVSLPNTWSESTQA